MLTDVCPFIVVAQEMSTLLRDQQWLYVNTADQLAHLSRGVLVQAW